MPRKRYIVHVDMDAFFAAIEQRDDPALRGKPVVIGADPKGGKGRGVVSTASYEARQFGIRSAMPISIAYRKCPSAVFLPVDMEKYSTVSDTIYQVLNQFTPDIEPVSIDEAFLDITGSYHLFGTPLKTCLLIKRRIGEATGGLTASVGLAPTKMAAKIASELKKPDGLVEVTREGLLEFLWPLEVGRIWGLGAKAEHLLNEHGIVTIGDLAKRSRRELISFFGAHGTNLWELAHGIDESAVVTDAEARSISNETTFDEDTLDDDTIKNALAMLAERVSDRLRRQGLKGRTITLKIRLTGFHTYTRATTLAQPTNFFDVIYQEATALRAGFGHKAEKVRLVGIKVSNFSTGHIRADLFDQQAEERRAKIHTAVDAIKKKFGDGAIRRARGAKKR